MNHPDRCCVAIVAEDNSTIHAKYVIVVALPSVAFEVCPGQCLSPQMSLIFDSRYSLLSAHAAAV